MKRLLTVSLTIAMVALCGAASAGQIWTDGNGDGLPDSGVTTVAPSTNVTIGVWIDAQSFNWTNYLAYVEWTGNCFAYISATYVITGGSNFPIDNFSHPRAIGFGGSGFNEGGVDHIGNYVLHLNLPTSCCVAPIIDIYNPYYVFSQLGAGSAYMLFTTNPGTCYGALQEPRGSCCLPDFSCIPNLTEAECAAAGGQWNQDQDCSFCLSGVPFEACCFIDGSCVDVYEGNCPPGSQPQGPGTSCATVDCPLPTEACCFCPFACVDLTPEECIAQGGVPGGAGTSCATFTCPGPREACCFPDGSCVEASVGACPAGSVPQGSDTCCGTADCPTLLVACCFFFGGCADVPPDVCESQGGVPQEPGTSCGSDACSSPTVGACCFDDSCAHLTEAECEARGGSWIGGGFPCGFVDCTSSAESKSWGAIKGLFR